MTYSKFPHFQLRRDFADELRFYETVRQPMSHDKYETLGRQVFEANGPCLLTTYEEYCKRKERLPKLDTFGIYAIRHIGSDTLHPRIEDYWNRLYIAYDGLFEDVVAGVRAACGLGAEDPCPILAAATAPVCEGKRYPTHFVRHNIRTGVATILPCCLYEVALDPYQRKDHARPTQRGSEAERQT